MTKGLDIPVILKLKREALGFEDICVRLGIKVLHADGTLTGSARFIRNIVLNKFNKKKAA